MGDVLTWTAVFATIASALAISTATRLYISRLGGMGSTPEFADMTVSVPRRDA